MDGVDVLIDPPTESDENLDGYANDNDNMTLRNDYHDHAAPLTHPSRHSSEYSAGWTARTEDPPRMDVPNGFSCQIVGPRYFCQHATPIEIQCVGCSFELIFRIPYVPSISGNSPNLWNQTVQAGLHNDFSFHDFQNMGVSSMVLGLRNGNEAPNSTSHAGDLVAPIPNRSTHAVFNTTSSPPMGNTASSSFQSEVQGSASTDDRASLPQYLGDPEEEEEEDAEEEEDEHEHEHNPGSNQDDPNHGSGQPGIPQFQLNLSLAVEFLISPKRQLADGEVATVAPIKATALCVFEDGPSECHERLASDLGARPLDLPKQKESLQRKVDEARFRPWYIEIFIHDAANCEADPKHPEKGPQPVQVNIQLTGGGPVRDASGREFFFVLRGKALDKIGLSMPLSREGSAGTVGGRSSPGWDSIEVQPRESKFSLVL